MAAVQRRSAQEREKPALIIPSRVIAALDVLDRAEQASVRRAFKLLERQGTAARDALEITPLHDDQSVYILHAAPQVRVILRMPLGAPIEVLDILRPETLQMLLQGRQN